jgi:hypothetical protein
MAGSSRAARLAKTGSSAVDEARSGRGDVGLPAVHPEKGQESAGADEDSEEGSAARRSANAAGTSAKSACRL